MDKGYYQFIVDKQHHAYRRQVDWALAADYAARRLDPAERVTDRFVRLCREEKAVIFPGEQIVLTRTVANAPDIFTQTEWEQLRKQYYLHESGFISNLSPDYYSVIRTGLLPLRETADALTRRQIDAILSLSDKYLEEARRQGRQDLVAVLTQVPRHAARTFREALQFFRILHFSLWLEGCYHNTVGRFDKELFPYLRQDLADGRLTEDTALVLLEDFFLSFNKDSDLYPGIQQGDNGQSMMLGGIDAEGKEVYNQLSALCLKASYNNRLIDPKINLRVSGATPQHIYTAASELTRAGMGFPQYSNDDVVIPALEKLGYSHEDASNYAVAACWEFIIPRHGTEVVNIASMSYPKAVDTALHADLLHAQTYEDFFQAVCRQIQAQSDALCAECRQNWAVPSPLMNLLMGCDVCKGGKYNNYGIHGTGIATAADSLAAIKRYVFDEGRITKEALIRAVDEDFANDPALIHLLRYEAPKLGNNDPFVDDIATALLAAFSKSLQGKRNQRGGLYRAGTGSAMNYLWQAEEIGASPDGRRAGEPFGTNFSVSLFARVKGPVSVIASMTKPDFSNAINGGPLTLEFDQSVFADADGAEKMGLLVKRFVALGGHQLQLNTVDHDALLDAQQHPERHRHLVVRIWGWSAYFVELDKEYQDHVLARQVYSL